MRAIERGLGAVVVDPKGDARPARSSCAAPRSPPDGPFIEWTPAGEHVYNPYARGGASEIADKALAGERFTEPHYLRQAQRYLGHAVRALRDVGAEVSLRDDRRAPRSGTAGAARPRAAGGTGADATFAYLDSLSPRQQRELAGVRDRLAILAESDVGTVARPADGGREPVRPAQRGAASGRSSTSASNPTAVRCSAQMLGAAIVQDLQTTVAALQGQPVPTLVAIDEFSAIAAEQVVRLFGRARSAGFSLLLGTQELSDLRLPGRERCSSRSSATSRC